MNKIFSLLILSVLILYLVPVVAQETPLLVYHYFGGKWEFYSGFIKITYMNETMILKYSFSSRILSIDSITVNGSSIIIKQSFLNGKITLLHIFYFNNAIPRVKIKNIIKGTIPTPLQRLFTRRLSYIIVLPRIKKMRETKIETSAFFFDWEDLRKSKCKYVMRKNAGIIKLEIDPGNNETAIIDPAIGYSSGNFTVKGFRMATPSYYYYEGGTGYKTVYSSRVYRAGDGSYHYISAVGKELVNATWLFNNIVGFNGFIRFKIIVSGTRVNTVDVYIKPRDGSTWDHVYTKSGTFTSLLDIIYVNATKYGTYFDVRFIITGYFLGVNFDQIVAGKDNAITYTVYYEAYSESNTTYRYTTQLPGQYDYGFYYPKGYVLKQSILNESYSLEHYVYSWNSTHMMYYFVANQYDTIEVVFTAWNSVTDLSTDYKYYRYGDTISVTARLLDPYNNPIANETARVWMGVQYTFNKTTITAQAYIWPGTVLAPHTHKWYFNGKDGYVEVADDPSLRIISMTLEALVYIPNVIPSGWRTIMEHARGTDNWYGLWKSPDGDFFHFRWGKGSVVNFCHKIYPNTWYHVVGVLNTSTSPAIVRTYQNGEIDMDFATKILPSEASGILLIGRSGYGEYWYGYIAFTRIYNHGLSESEISNAYSKHIINATGLVLFLDATFYNGTHYIDLSPYGNHGISYGGVQRLEDENKWIWIVYSLRDDNLVHLEWFPIGSRIRFLNASTGELVREIFVDSNDMAISIPEGNYTVEAIIADGYYQEQYATTDSSGYIHVDFTAPNYDAEIVVQMEYNGTYAGVKNTICYSTGYTWSISYTPSQYVRKGDSITMTFTAKRTVDNSGVDGILYIGFNSTTYAVGLTGSGVKIFYSSKSGEWNLTYYNFTDSQGSGAVSLNRVDLLAWCGVNLNYTVSPEKYFYSYGEPLTLNISLYYDTLQARDWNITLYIYREGVLNQTINDTAPGGRYTLTIQASYNTTIVISIHELDGKDTVYTLAFKALSIEVTGKGYATGSKSIIEAVIEQASGSLQSIIGEYTLVAYVPGQYATYIDRSDIAVTIYWKSFNGSTLELHIVLSNKISNPCSVNMSIVFRPLYSAEETWLNQSYSLAPYEIQYHELYYTLPQSYNMRPLEYTVYINNEKETEDIAPLLVGLQGIYKPYYMTSFVGSNTETVILELPTVNKVLLQAITALNIYQQNITTVSITDLETSVSVYVSQRIYESGENVPVIVTINSTYYPMTIDVYVIDSLVRSISISGNGSYTVYITVPDLAPYRYDRIPIIVKIRIGNDVVSEKTVYIDVFNRGPYIDLISPSEGSTINGTVSFIIHISDPSGVKSVVWRFDVEDEWHNTTIDENGNVNITVDTHRYGNGLIRLIIRATDNNDFESEERYSFYINNIEMTADLFLFWKGLGSSLAQYIIKGGILGGIVTATAGAVVTYILMKRRRQKIVVEVKGIKGQGEARVE